MPLKSHLSPQHWLFLFLLPAVQGLESVDTAEWQSFDLSQHLDPDQYLTEIDIVVKGTGSGAPGFKMLDFRAVGTIVDNPTGVYHVRPFIRRLSRGDIYET